MAFIQESKTRWLDIELEGRLISSLVACCVVLMVQSNRVSAAVALMAVSQAVDLIRCYFRNHSLSHAIQFHHTIVMALSAVFFGMTLSAPLKSATRDLLMMETTNPFLHSAWVLSKHPSQIHLSKQRQLMGLCVLVLWPYYRIYNLILVVQQTWMHFGFVINSCVMCLMCLQVYWYILLLQMFIQSLVKRN